LSRQRFSNSDFTERPTYAEASRLGGPPDFRGSPALRVTGTVRL
jgi:hypothetical protein